MDNMEFDSPIGTHDARASMFNRNTDVGVGDLISDLHNLISVRLTGNFLVMFRANLFLGTIC